MAELTDTDPMTLVRTLDRMQHDEWIERRPDPADRRAHRLYLCEAAKPIMNRMWKIADQARRGTAVLAAEVDRCRTLGAAREPEQLADLLERVHGVLLQLEAK